MINSNQNLNRLYRYLRNTEGINDSITIQEYQLFAADEDNLNRLAEYLGIDITGLSKEDVSNILVRRVL